MNFMEAGKRWERWVTGAQQASLRYPVCPAVEREEGGGGWGCHHNLDKDSAMFTYWQNHELQSLRLAGLNEIICFHWSPRWLIFALFLVSSTFSKEAPLNFMAKPLIINGLYPSLYHHAHHHPPDFQTMELTGKFVWLRVSLKTEDELPSNRR